MMYSMMTETLCDLDRPVQREWAVGLKVDSLPPNWSYTGKDRFAPDVSELVKL